MSNGSPSSSGRIGWLCAALLLGVLAGAGIVWIVVSRRPTTPPVVIYQMPSPTAAATPDDTTDHSARHRHHNFLTANELPPILRGVTELDEASSAATPTLAAGIGEAPSPSAVPSASPEVSAADSPRETMLVDGVALTRPRARPTPPVAASAAPAVSPVPDSAPSPRPGLDPATVEDSLTVALDGIQQYLKEKYELREETWGGQLTVGDPRSVMHQLFKGNEYWFSMGSSATGSRIRVRLYDSDGHRAETNYWQQEARDGSYAAAQIQCQHTGAYYVVVSVEKAPDQCVPWGLVYAYR